MKAFINNCVFSHYLNASRVSACVTLKGGSFHKLGAATEKARSPYFFDWLLAALV